ncbi:MAG: endopeptidase La [Candidatus Merdivicinus sp.]|jgi:ATP-dependent Lon protease
MGTGNRPGSTVILPAVSMRGIVMFPSMLLHFDVGREKSILAVKQAMEHDKEIFLVAQKDYTVEDPKEEDLYKVGVVAKIVQMLHTDKNSVRIMVEGLYRAAVVKTDLDGPYMTCEVKTVGDQRMPPLTDEEKQALFRAVVNSFEHYCEMVPKIPREIIANVYAQKTLSGLFDKIVQNLFFQVEDKQAMLEERNLVARLEMLVALLERETNILSIEQDIYSQVKESMDKNQRDYFLREQLRVISNELGEGDNPQEESMEYMDQIQKIKCISEESREKLLKECDRLYRMPPQSQEAQVVRGYLEAVLALPWDTVSKEHADVEKARKVLDHDHYGMKKVKERILELIAVRKLAPDIKGQIICLAGPPGVGKTSVAKSIAKALGRKYVRISLGGVRDEADIRGHRKTYLGSMPGRIMDAMRQAGTRNPLMLLDEIDKMGADFKGDPSSAMLEVLDSEQNNAFRDHYLEVPFDLSEVLFITTANNVSNIPGPLYDRMEIIEMGSYTREEKWNIAKKHLIPKQMKRHGLNGKQLKFSKEGIYTLIDGYTRESGVRNLEREVGSICRKTAKAIVSEEATSVNVTPDTLQQMLGGRKFLDEGLRPADEVGVVTGLAWTSVGGETMDIETIVLPGTGKIQITGQLGEVMTESAQIAVSYVRSVAADYGIAPDFYKDKDIHIHAPEGAVPKDGPSAGVTMVTAITSALSGIPVRRDVAMTGEVTLRGRVLPIGGLREKSMAAYRMGVKTVFIPEENRKDLEEVDEVVKENIAFVPVSHVSEVLKGALVRKPESSAVQQPEPSASVLPENQAESKSIAVQ